MQLSITGTGSGSWKVTVQCTGMSLNILDKHQNNRIYTYYRKLYERLVDLKIIDFANSERKLSFHNIPEHLILDIRTSVGVISHLVFMFLY